MFPRILAAIFVRVAILWTLIRGATAWGFLAEEDSLADALISAPVQSVVAFLVTLTWVGLDVGRRGELTFLGYAGVKPVYVALLISAECVLLETALRVVLR